MKALPLLLGMLIVASRLLDAQPAPHHFSSIVVIPDRTITLSLGGSVANLISLSGGISNQFMQMFDLYPVEASSNLADWTPLTSLLRTNNNSNPLLVEDIEAASLDKRFYRTPTNHLVTALPKPSGLFAVGTFDRAMIDPARTSPYRYSPATNAFMVTFWYPAAPTPVGVLPAPMWDKRLASDASASSAYGFDSRWPLVFPKLVGHRFVGVPLATNPAKLPIIIYCHGLMGGRKLQSQAAEDLASHGYVVVAIDHTDCWATEFSDGRYLVGNHSGDVPRRLQDMRFLLDELANLNGNDPLLAGRLDLDRIGVYGISFGGMVVETCRTDQRVKCAALWDAMNVQLNSAGLQKPLLVALGESNMFFTEDQWLFSKAVTDATFLQIRDAQHLTASDVAWTVYCPQGRRPALAINACMVWFFDTYLKGEAPVFPTNPEIYNVSRK